MNAKTELFNEIEQSPDFLIQETLDFLRYLKHRVRNHTDIINSSDSLYNFIASLPAGNRTKADIDAQILEERDSWGDR